MDGLVDFEGKKLVEIDMTDLDASIKEKWLDGTPVGGITHYDLLQFILETFGSQCTPRIEKMYAVNNHDKVRPGVTQNMDLAERFGNDAAETMIFRRVHALIYLGTPMEEVSTAVAVSWHQLGFTIGIGPNVRVCDNGCILSAEHIVSSYSLPCRALKKCKLPLEIIKETVQGWARDFSDIDNIGLDFIERMKGLELDYNNMMQLFGKLGFDRVRSDLGTNIIETTPFAALNQSQLNVAMSRYARDHFGKGCKKNKTITAWEAMNYLNYPLKPSSCDVPLILPQQYAVTEAMLIFLQSK